MNQYSVCLALFAVMMFAVPLLIYLFSPSESDLDVTANDVDRLEV